MITLTNPAKVSTVLGSAALTNYDRLDLLTIVMDVANKSISGQCQLVSSGTPTATPIIGSYSIPTTGSAQLAISIPNIPFFATLPLTSAQQATVQNWVQTTQNTIESGLVAVGVVAGVQSTGF
jgi:hypothetical protein